MSDLKKIYRVTLRELRSKSKKTLQENEQAYRLLKNKDSDYANIILAIQKLNRQVSEIYDNAPDEIVFDHEAF